MAKTDFEYGTLITPEFLDLLFYKDHGSGKRGIQFDGVDDDGHLPQIITEFLADNAVSTAKLANASVSNAKIQDNAVSTGKVQDGAITNPKIGDGAVDTRTLGNGAVTSPKLGTQAVAGVNISSGAIVAPLKKTPNAQAQVYLDFQGFSFDLTTGESLRLSNAVRQSLVTNPLAVDSTEDTDTYFKEFQFGAFTLVETFGVSGKKYRAVCDTGIAFDSNTIVLAQATAKTIVHPDFASTFAKGVLAFGSSSWIYKTTYETGYTYSEPYGILTFRKKAGGTSIEAVLEVLCGYETGRRNFQPYTFRLLMAYRAG